MVRVDTNTPRPRQVLRSLGFEAQRIRLVSHRENAHWIADGAAGRVVLRRYGPARSLDDVAYEHRLLRRLAAREWPVAPPLDPPLTSGGFIWCVFPYLPGRRPSPRSPNGMVAEQRKRGRLLAQLH
jgi:Ser/Thr protein kinase RdoA (MazF antagonist)